MYSFATILLSSQVDLGLGPQVTPLILWNYYDGSTLELGMDH